MKSIVQEFQFEIYRYSQTPISSYYSLYKSTGTNILPDKLSVACIDKSFWLAVCIGLTYKNCFKALHLLTTESDCSVVLLCGWQDLKMQLFTYLFVDWQKPLKCSPEFAYSFACQLKSTQFQSPVSFDHKNLPKGLNCRMFYLKNEWQQVAFETSFRVLAMCPVCLILYSCAHFHICVN